MSFYQVLLEQFTRFMSGKLIKNVQLCLYVKFTARGGGSTGGNVTKRKTNLNNMNLMQNKTINVPHALNMQ